VDPGRDSLAEPRLGRDLSRLTAHEPQETPLQHAVTKMVGLIARPHHDDEGAAGAVDERSLGDYVRASLGMKHDADKIDPGLRPYLDELSRSESSGWAQPPVTRDSFTLLCILHLADQKPVPVAHGEFTRDAFMGWLERQLGPGTVGDETIPEEYFETVQVSRTHSNRCAVQYDGDANSVVVQTMRPFDRNYLRHAYLPGASLGHAPLAGAYLTGANLGGANLTHAFLRGAWLQGANLAFANLQNADLYGARLEDDANLTHADLTRANLTRANLPGATLEGATLTHADLTRADLTGANMAGATLEGATLTHADLTRADLTGANLTRANLKGAKLQDTKLDLTAELADHLFLTFPIGGANLTGARLVMSEEAAASWQELVAARMATWRAGAFDTHFNHRDNLGHNVLKTIAGLHESCRDTKQVLMRGVVAGLDFARTSRPAEVRARALIPSLGDVLFEDPEYLRDHDAFAEWLCAGLLGDGSTPLDPMLSDTALKALDVYATRLLEAQGFKAILQRGNAIFQVLHEVRQRAESAP
jgi:uncharacterized protein YjbI with pentapeptide repeats